MPLMLPLLTVETFTTAFASVSERSAHCDCTSARDVLMERTVSFSLSTVAYMFAEAQRSVKSL